MSTRRISVVRELLPLLFAVILTGCATQSPPSLPVQPPKLPAPPAELMEPPASGLWSDSVRQLFKKWQKLLTPAKPA